MQVGCFSINTFHPIWYHTYNQPQIRYSHCFIYIHTYIYMHTHTHIHIFQNKCIFYQESPPPFPPLSLLELLSIFWCLCMIMTLCLWYLCLVDHVHTASHTLICDDSIVLASALQSLAAFGYVQGSEICENYE
jgi:hypothetical protein